MELIDLNEVVSDVGRLLAHTLGDDIKVSVSLAKGKKDYDKRETIKRREADRETRAAIKSRR